MMRARIYCLFVFLFVLFASQITGSAANAQSGPISITNVILSPSPISITGQYLTLSATITDSTAGATLNSATAYIFENGYYYTTVTLYAAGNNVYSTEFYVYSNTRGAADKYTATVYAGDTDSQTAGPVASNADSQPSTSGPISITNAALSPASVPLAGGPVTVKANISDPTAGATITYAYAEFFRNGQYYTDVTMTGSGGAYSSTYSLPPNATGATVTWLAAVYAEDSLGQSFSVDAAGSTSQASAAGPPVVTGATLSPSSIPVAGGTVTVTAQVTDPTAGATFSSVYGQLDRNGIFYTSFLLSNTSGNTYTGTYTLPPNTTGTSDTWTAAVVPTDSLGQTLTVDATGTTTQASALGPVAIASAAQTPASLPVGGGTLTVKAKITDPTSSATITDAYVALYRNGEYYTDFTLTGTGSAYTGTYKTPANTIPAAVIWTTQVTAQDSLNQYTTVNASGSTTEAATSGPIAITNAKMTPASVPFAGGTVTITANVTDPTAAASLTSVSATLYLNGLSSTYVTLTRTTGSTYSGTYQLPANNSGVKETWTAQVNAQDSLGQSVNQTATGSTTEPTSVGGPPVITGAAIGPATLSVSDGTITLTAKVTDPVAGATVQSVQATLFTNAFADNTVNLTNGGSGSTYTGTYAASANSGGSTNVFTAAITATDSLGQSTTVDAAGSSSQPASNPSTAVPVISNATVSPSSLPTYGGYVTVSATITTGSDAVQNADAEIFQNGQYLTTISLNTGGVMFGGIRLGKSGRSVSAQDSESFTGTFYAPSNQSGAAITYTSIVGANNVDGNAAPVAASGSSVVSSASPIAVTGAALTPTSVPSSGGSISVSATVSDPNAGATIYGVYAYIYQDGVYFAEIYMSGSGAYTGTYNVPPNTSGASHTYTASISVSDSDGATGAEVATGATTQAAATSSPPVVTASLTPASVAATGGTVTVTASVADPNTSATDQYSYATLYRNGFAYTTVGMTGTSTSLTGSINLPANTSSSTDTWTASVTYENSFLVTATAAASGSTTQPAVGGGPPVITGAALTPASVGFLGGAVTVKARITDPTPGATLSSVYGYFYRNGQFYSETALTGSGSSYTGTYNLPANSTGHTEIWSAQVTAYDNFNQYSSVSASGTTTQVSSSGAPSLSNVTLTPSTVPLTGGTITISAKVTDPIAGASLYNAYGDIYLNGYYYTSIDLTDTAGVLTGTYNLQPNLTGATQIWTASVSYEDTAAANAFAFATGSTSEPGADGPPTITNAAVSPATLAAGGGPVTVTAKVTDPTTGVALSNVYANIYKNGFSVTGVTLSNGGSGSAYSGTYTAPANGSTTKNVYTATVIATDSLNQTTTVYASGSSTEATYTSSDSLTGTYWHAPANTITSIALAQAYMQANTASGTFTSTQSALAAGYSTAWNATFVQFLGPDAASFKGADAGLNDAIVQLTGSIAIPAAGTYTFTLTSDDGSALFIDGAEVIDDDGAHGATTVSGTATLSAGSHAVNVVYFNTTSGGSAYLQLLSSVGTFAQAGVGPSITNPSISPATLPAAGGTITVSAAVTDTTAKITSVTASVNGKTVTLSNGGSGTSYSGKYTASANTSGSPITYTALISAADSAGATAGPVTAAGSTVQANDAGPVITKAAISPAALSAAGGPITVTATVTDASAAIASVTATVNGNAISLSAGAGGSYSGTYTASANTSSTKITYTASVSAKDNLGVAAGPVAATGSTVESNDAGPVIASPAISPATLTASGGAITVSAHVTDTGATVQSVTAAVNGHAITLTAGAGGAYSGTYNAPANTTAAPITYTASVSAKDNLGIAAGPVAAVGSTVEANDTGPSITNAAISPATLTVAGGNVTVSATITDPESALVNVSAELLLNGGAWQSLTLTNGGSGSTYSATYAAPANASISPQTITATVTASDALLFTATANAAGSTVQAGDTGEPGQLPNLEVSQAAVVNSAVEAQQVTVSWTVINVGLGETTGNWNDGLYLSLTPSLSTGAIPLGSFENAATLGPGGSYTQTEQIQLPAGTYGSYYLVVVANTNNSIQETTTADNSTAEPIDITQLEQLVASPGSLGATLIPNAPQTATITLSNTGTVAETGITATVTGLPSNVTLSVGQQSTLAAGAAAEIQVTATATGSAVQSVSPVIRFTDQQGDTATVNVNLNVVPPVPNLVVKPGSIVTGMVIGTQTVYSLTVTNAGGAEATGLVVQLPPAASTPWLTLSSPATIGNLAPGATAQVMLLLSPASNQALGLYSGQIAINGTNTGVPVPYTINCVSSATGSVTVTSSDEFTYFAATHPPLAGATVTITSPLTGDTVATGTTDQTGTYQLASIPAGSYNIDVSAPGHTDYRGSFLVAAGETATIPAFLSRQLVTYQWTVVPESITDQYQVTLQAVFQTNVPAPVVTISPASVDLSKLVFDQSGQAVVQLTVSNHGLIAANNVYLTMPTGPSYTFTSNITQIGTLAPLSSVVVNVTITQGGTVQSGVKANAVTADDSGGGCTDPVTLFFSYICDTTHTGSASVSFTSPGCTGAGGGGVPPGGGGGVAYGGGPSISVSLPNICDPCVQAVLYNVATCLIGFIPFSCVPSFIINAAECVKSALTAGPPGSPSYANAMMSCILGGMSAGASCAAKSLPGLGTAINLASCANNLWSILLTCYPKAFGSGGSGGASGSFRTAHTVRALASGTELSGLVGDVNTEAQRLQAELGPLVVIFGNQKWFTCSTADAPKFAAFYSAFLTTTTTNGPATPISAAQRSALEQLPLPAQLAQSDVDALVQRWNNTITYYNEGIVNSTQVPSGQSTNFIAQDTLVSASNQAQDASTGDAADGYNLFGQGLETAEQNVENYILNPDNEQAGVCATVKIQLSQTVEITRTAFSATLDLTNSGQNVPLSAIGVNIKVTDANGNDVTSLFSISTPATSVFGGGGVDGTGTLAVGQTGAAQWSILPSEQAGANGAATYYVSGTVTYTQNGTAITIPLYPTGITVVPDPYLKLHYFLQTTVYGQDPTDLLNGIIDPTEPFSLGILVDNVGKGVAHNMTITSSQPVVTDNAKDLLISFQIIGAMVNLQPVSPSLTLDFGDIEPQSTAVGTFLMESSLAGTFTSFSASYQHVDDLGGLSSLIDSIDTHALNHVVRIVDPSDDGKPDFLTEETANANDLPDTVWNSAGAAESPVTPITDAISDGAVSNSNLTVHVSFPDTPSGFLYLQMNDPGDGNYALVSVTRSDGKPILVGPNAWTTKREVHPLTGGATLETRFCLFDDNGAGDTYTVVYAPIAPTLTSLSPATLPAGSPRFTLDVLGTGFVNGATVTFNGTAVPTVFISPNELEGVVPASAVTTQAQVPVGVLNPNEQGTAASPLTFIVGPAPPKPQVTITSPANGSTTQAPASVTLKATATETSGTIVKVDYYANGTWIGSATTAPYTLTLATPAVGLYSYTATATDTNGVTGTSPAVTLTVVSGGSAPSPVILSLSPSSTPQGSAPFTLGLTGTGFNEESEVAWNGQLLPTTFVSATALTADVAASLLLQAGAMQVTVTNPALTNEVSGAYLFDVTPVTIVAPTISITAPASGAVVALNTPVTLSATATPSTGATIVEVDFYANNTLVGTATAAPYSVQWTPGSAGPVTITAVVADSNFLTATATRVSLTVAGTNPVPALRSLSSASATVGSAGFTLTVTGSNFNSASTVYWNGAPLSTSYGSGTSLTAALTATQLAVAGAFPVTVVNPAPGGGTSNALTFTVGSPSLSLSSISMVISGKDVVGTLKITNSGTAAAAGVSLTGASLQTAAGVISASNLPLSVSSIAAGGSQTLTLTFPGAAPASATAGLVKLTGSYLPSGAFSLSGVGSIP